MTGLHGMIHPLTSFKGFSAHIHIKEHYDDSRQHTIKKKPTDCNIKFPIGKQSKHNA